MSVLRIIGKFYENSCKNSKTTTLFLIIWLEGTLCCQIDMSCAKRRPSWGCHLLLCKAVVKFPTWKPKLLGGGHKQVYEVISIPRSGYGVVGVYLLSSMWDELCLPWLYNWWRVRLDNENYLLVLENGASTTFRTLWKNRNKRILWVKMCPF